MGHFEKKIFTKPNVFLMDLTSFLKLLTNETQHKLTARKDLEHNKCSIYCKMFKQEQILNRQLNEQNFKRANELSLRFVHVTTINHIHSEGESPYIFELCDTSLRESSFAVDLYYFSPVILEALQCFIYTQRRLKFSRIPNLKFDTYYL